MRIPEDGDDQLPADHWDIDVFALMGAGAGALVGMGYEVAEAFSRDVMRQDPFLQIVLEMGVAALVGAVLFAAVAIFHNRRIQG
jgi:hypothetical protein